MESLIGCVPRREQSGGGGPEDLGRHLVQRGDKLRRCNYELVEVLAGSSSGEQQVGLGFPSHGKFEFAKIVVGSDSSLIHAKQSKGKTRIRGCWEEATLLEGIPGPSCEVQGEVRGHALKGFVRIETGLSHVGIGHGLDGLDYAIQNGHVFGSSFLVFLKFAGQ